MAAENRDEGEWPHHQILRVHRQYAFRQHLRIQEAVPFLLRRRAIPKSLSLEMANVPENTDDNINFLLAYLREAKVERFVRFIEALGDSSSAFAESKPIKSHGILVDTMSEALERISNADMDQVRRIRTVVKSVKEGQKLKGKAEGVAVSTEVKPTEQGLLGSGVVTDTTTNVVQLPTNPKGIVGSESEARHSKALLHMTETKAVDSTNPQPSSIEEKVSVSQTKTVSIIEELEMKNSSTYKFQEGFVKPGIARFFKRDGLKHSQTSWLVNDSTHGIKIDIPFDAVPSDILLFAVVGHAYLCGNFEIPEEYEVCTAIFTLRTYPDFDFIKPVLLTLPHSAIFDGDEEDEDLVVLRAEDHTVSGQGQPHTCVYQFNDVLESADYDSEEGYVQVYLNHFSSVVGAKRRMKYRRNMHFLSHGSVSLRRHSSTSKQRRSRKSGIKVRMKKVRAGDSIGPSRQSSYEGSFERDLTRQCLNLSRQSSSAESDGASQRSFTLHRQTAIDNQPDAPVSLIHQASSGDDDPSCNEICVLYCFPQLRCTSWKNRFFVAPNHNTGRKALEDAKNDFERYHVGSKVGHVLRTASPNSKFVGFEPDEWTSKYWIVKATPTPVITLDLVTDPMWSGKPQYVDFEAESTNRSNQSSPTHLHHKITVTGVELAGKELFFTIQSSKDSVNREHEIEIKSWLYLGETKLLRMIENLHTSEESSIVLNPEHMATFTDADNFRADICKLMADIALQITDEQEFFDQLPISESNKRRLSSQENDLIERMYKAFFVWINEKRSHLLELQSLLQKIGYRMKLSSSHLPSLIATNPSLNDRPCDRKLCINVARRANSKHWKFIGRFLGLGDTYDGDLSNIAHMEGIPEAVYQMLERWRQQFGPSASIASLVKAIYRVNELSSCSVQDAVNVLERDLTHEESFQ